VTGRLVRTLVDGPRPAGRHAVIWDGRDERGGDAGSGVYFSRLVWPGGSEAKRMLLLR